ncbi:VOC family protein [Nocardioides caeni]|uniref:VOC family protein n=1 Tax=Nocardioides caeni TaxID=574700 RepID=A0A4S8NN06_9ACTN|nr:VOC family protein [Nocardioides caeni]THV17975.1 VOC family protein [Nocardioides caeni]
MDIRWLTAFLDNGPDVHQESVGFWQQATGYGLSSPRGDAGEFASLEPPVGDAYLKVQRRGHGESRVHLDLHVADPGTAADAAVVAGATRVLDSEHGYVVMASPTGLVFCFVDHPAAVRPEATERPDGSLARVRQVAIDVPPASYGVEWDFWRAVTGWQERPSTITEDFRFLLAPEGQPLGLLLQRLGPDDDGEIRAHLDWGTTDRAAETERHLALGARVLAQHSHWTVLEDPTGRAYCLTDGDPR